MQTCLNGSSSLLDRNCLWWPEKDGLTHFGVMFLAACVCVCVSLYVCMLFERLLF